MENILLSINEASALIGKSPQTVRRLVKSKKIKFRRKRTPQGFNYFVEKQSLLEYFDFLAQANGDDFMSDVSNDASDHSTFDEGLHSIPVEPASDSSQNYHEKTIHIDEQGSVFSPSSSSENSFSQRRSDEDAVFTQSQNYERHFQDFNSTLQRLIDQYERVLSHQEEDKRNLYKLVETFQERIITLESKIQQLEAPKKKRKWYHFF